MTFLFLLFLITGILIVTGLRRTALVIAVITLFLCFAMLWFHATDTLGVVL